MGESIHLLILLLKDAEPGLITIMGIDFQLRCVVALFEETNYCYKITVQDTGPVWGLAIMC